LENIIFQYKYYITQEGVNVNMSIDTEKIKDALDAFQDDNFVQAKTLLQKEIKKAKDEYIATKCELKGSKQETNKEE
jgi:hypothetical protein